MQRAKWLALQVLRTWSGLLSVSEKSACIVNSIRYATFTYGDGVVKFDLLNSNRDKLAFKWHLRQVTYSLFVEADLIAGLRVVMDLRLRDTEELRGVLLNWLHAEDALLPNAAEKLDLVSPST